MVRPPVSEGICLRCKGARLLCGKETCPILMKTSILKSSIPFDYKKIQRDKILFGASPPAVFVGRFGYPNVQIGPMIPIDDIYIREEFDLPTKDNRILDISEFWFGKALNEIVKFRTSMVRSNFNINVNYNDSSYDSSSPQLVNDVKKKMQYSEGKLFEATQELSMSQISVDTETKFSKIWINKLELDNHAPPSGPSGLTEKIDIIDNIKVHKKVDYVVNDTDLKAADAIFDYLYKTNLNKSNVEIKDPNSYSVVTGTEMQRLLSSGLLGIRKARKLVPTRWSITAVDTIISKRLAKEIKNFPEINQYYTFHKKYLDNNFIILFIPGPWSYEMMEVWNTNTLWTQDVPGVQKKIIGNHPNIVQDYEMEKGRKNYADNITGAYYAARKEVTEFLYRYRKQARVIVFREVSSGYLVPLGVWVIRETVRKALEEGWNGPNVQKGDNLSTMLGRINEEFSIPLKNWIKASKLLKNIRIQRRLDEWIKMNPRKF